MIFAKIFKKLHEIDKILSWGVHMAGVTPLDLATPKEL